MGNFGVSWATVFYWETNRVSPAIKYTPRIIEFLGYSPYDSIAEMTLGEKMLTVRRTLGGTREELAKRLGVDHWTLEEREKAEDLP